MTNPTIQVINYELIRARHPDELLKLAEACRPPPTGLGFFRLDLRMRLPKRAITEINAATRDYFAQPEKVKVQEGISKHTGKQRLWLSTIEALEIPTKELAEDLPKALQPSLARISRSVTILEQVAKDIFSCLYLAAVPSADHGPNFNGESVLTLCFEGRSKGKRSRGHRAKAGKDITRPGVAQGILRIMEYDEARLRCNLDSAAGREKWCPALQPQGETSFIVFVGDGLEFCTGGHYHAAEYKYIKFDGDEEGSCSFEYTLRDSKAGDLRAIRK